MASFAEIEKLAFDLPSLTRILLLLASAGLVACAPLSTLHGDAVLSHSRGWPLQAANFLTFPKIPIGRVGRFQYQVLNLPEEIYPTSFTFEIPAKECDAQRHDQPWRNCRLRVSLESLVGEPILDEKIDFSKDWNGNADFSGNLKRPRIALLLKGTSDVQRRLNLSKFRSYRIKIDVVRPSSRESDKLSVYAPRLVIATFPHQG